MLTDDQLDELYFDAKFEGNYSYPRTIDNFVKALRILETLCDRNTYNLQGEHDEIFVWAGPPTSDEQQIELDRLGFRYEGEGSDSWRINT